MADDFDFGFSAVSTEEFQKTQTTTEVESSAVSSDEFDELKKKMDSISSLIQALGDKEDTSYLVCDNGQSALMPKMGVSSWWSKADWFVYLEQSFNNDNKIRK